VTRVLPSPAATLLAAPLTAAAFLLLAILLTFSNRPLLSLDPDGITLRWLAGRTRIPWDELALGPQPEPRALTLHHRRPTAAIGSEPTEVRLPVRGLHIDAGFLAGTIRRYTDTPSRRAGIGTTEELAALRTVGGGAGRGVCGAA